eukprot:m.253170 g.253170  ORF g.253170 m.253170 type:complete len:130 (+) comp40368_c2_seq5:5196-5585(+)
MAIFLNCGHSFHQECFSSAGGVCMYCAPFLKDKIQELAKKFNTNIQSSSVRATERERHSNELDSEEDEATCESETDGQPDSLTEQLLSQLSSLPRSETRPRYASALHRRRVLLEDHDYCSSIGYSLTAL